MVNINNISTISVIVPIYNSQDYLAKCVKSITSQVFTDLEIILINDGSTDNSIEIANYYADKDKRIRVINQENQGSSAVRNKGIDVAKGEYIGYVDGDDWIDCDMYKTLYENIRTHNADVSICDYRHIDINGNKVDSRQNEADFKSPLVLSNTHEIMKHYLIKRDMNPWNKLYKKSLFDTVRFPIGKTYEDCFTIYHILEKANIVVAASDKKYNYVSHLESISNSQFSKETFDLIEGHIEQHKFFESNYSELSKYSRKHLYGGLLTFVNKGYIKDKLEIYYDEITQIIDRIRVYPYEDCGLSVEDEKLVKLLLKSLRSYIIGGRIAKNRGVNK